MDQEPIYVPKEMCLGCIYRPELLENMNTDEIIGLEYVSKLVAKSDVVVICYQSRCLDGNLPVDAWCNWHVNNDSWLKAIKDMGGIEEIDVPASDTEG